MAHILVSGRVQGVSFRYYLQAEASRLGVSGWCRNLPDGRVEAIVSGAHSLLESLVAWCHQGSPSARVEHVEVQWLNSSQPDSSAHLPNVSPSDFQISTSDIPDSAKFARSVDNGDNEMTIMAGFEIRPTPSL